METTVITIKGMSCSHCNMVIKNALTALKGVNSVDINLSNKTAKVEYNPEIISVETIQKEIEAQGYEIE